MEMTLYVKQGEDVEMTLWITQGEDIVTKIDGEANVTKVMDSLTQAERDALDAGDSIPITTIPLV